MSAQHSIAASDRIPFFQKFTFAAGVNMDFVATSLMTSVLWLPFFNIGLGISPLVLGIILMVLRAWDAITDPIMGNISDNARTRWGRRRPFMLVGAITTACLYPLIWHLPQSVMDGTSWLAQAADWVPFISRLEMTAPDKAATLYLILIGMIFFASFTLWSMPYYGMQLELTPNYDERTRLTVWMSFFNKISMLIGGWVLTLVIFTGMLALGDPQAMDGKPEWLQSMLAGVQPWLASLAGAQPEEKPIVVGMRLVCWLIAAGIGFFGLLPALFVKERYYEAKATARQERDPFWKSIGESLRCGPLWSLIGASFFITFGASSVGSLGQYVNFYYVCRGDLTMGAMIAGMKGTVLVVSGIVSLPFFTWLGERYDKRTVVLVMLGISMGGHLLNFVLMTPEHPYWQIIPAVFESSAFAAVWLFMGSMKADVADWDEQSTTRRREGAINAFYSWFIKAALTVSMGVGGLVLQISGFDVKLDEQPEAVLWRMFVIYQLLPLAIWAFAIVSVWLYPLTRHRSAQIRAELEIRRGAL